MPNPAVDIQTLSTAFPIALLPVRIETRFSTTTSPPSLQIRIYPDEIFANFHEEELTDREYADGVAYWTEAWEPTQEPSAWAKLVPRYQAPRAAWIANVCTPTNVASRPSGSAIFPTVGRRPDQLANATTIALPSAWVVIAYRGGEEVTRFVSSAVQSPLQLGFRPDIKEDDPSLKSYDELRLEPELAWMIDFVLASQAGMAMTMPITSTDLQLGFDRVVVFGVKAPLDPQEGAKQLASLVDAHHYTRGLALVRQGTPTNNTGDEPAGYPPPAAPAYSFPIERGAPLATAGGDGARLATAFGIPATSFDHVEGADRHEDANAQAMTRALWPCTLGYFLQQIAAASSADQISDLRAHVDNFVRGRGPYATFRIGRVPYGVLPVTSLSRWKTASTSSIDVKLPSFVETWRRVALARASDVARVGKTDDADADLLGVLALDASAREVRLREAIGPAHLANLFILLGDSSAAEATARTNLMHGLGRPLGLYNVPLRFGQFTFASRAPRINRSMAANEPLSETLSLADDYITWIRNATIAALRAAGVPGSTTFNNPLLFHLLRQAALVEYGRIALDLAITHGAATALDRVEPELLNIAPGTETRISPWSRFATSLPAVSGTTPLGDWLLDPTSNDAERLPVRDFQAALDALARLSTAELDRLTAETLDTCAYRLDAWITSFATRRLQALRDANPVGVHLGAYAWVEDLKPLTTSRPGRSGGFIHAPSASHAAAAAILRSGYLSRTGAERDQIAMNLTSRRVRTGLELIDGVRQGQPIGALLGYRFERAMHAAALDKYIEPFRAAFPLGADPGSPPSSTSERIPARSVVDGLALRTALAGATTATTINWASYPSQIATTDHDGVAACLLQLDADVDATADLALAETIYQTVQGNTDRASATLAGLAGGAVLPDPQIAQIPARATTFTQRVAVLLGDPESVAAGWNRTAPRSQANARLDAWAAWRLGDPSNVHAVASYAPDPAHADQLVDVTIALPDLGLCALDVIDLARRTPPEGGGELAARISWRVAQGLGIGQPIDRITYDVPAGLSFLDMFEAARRLGDVLAGARALLPVDLTQDATGAQTGDTTELLGRGSLAKAALQSARDALSAAATAAVSGTPSDVATLRAALWAVSGFGVRSAIPATALGTASDAVAALIASATASVAEADRRLAAITAAPTDGAVQLTAAFGPEFVPLPVFSAGNRADVLAAIAGAPAIVDNDALAARRWFDGVSRVRAPLGRVCLAALASEALRGNQLDLIATQLPLGTRWIGLEYDRNSTARPVAGTLSLVLEVAFDTNAETWAGLALDEWTEAIPADTQSTAFAVNYDAPGAEAPQCVVLAVPPDTGANWDLDTLAAIVGETADLARVRAVDPDLLGDYSQFVPTTYIAANIADDTIALDLAYHCIDEPLVLEAE